MNLTNLFKGSAEGILEIEENYLQFLWPENGAWSSKRVMLNGQDLFEVLRKKIPEIFTTVTRISVVAHLYSGSKLLPFPKALNKEEIIEHLKLKREEYFGSKTTFKFALREIGTNEANSNDYLVSYIQMSFFDRLKQTVYELGYTLNKVSTVIEALIGAYLDQKASLPSQDQICLLSLGFSDVNMVVLRKGKVIGVRTAITGSIKELELRLMQNLNLSLDQVKLYLTGEIEDADPNSVEIIRQNQRELMARITPFFAFIRSKRNVAGSQSIFLATPYLEIAGIKELLEQTFRGDVHSLNANVDCRDAIDGDSGWLKGGTNSQVISFLPAKSPFLQFILTPRICWMFILFFLLVPLGILKLNIVMLDQRIESLKMVNKNVRPLLEQVRVNQEKLRQFYQITGAVNAELSSQKFMSSLLPIITSQKEDELRFEEIAVSPETGALAIKGFSLETEKALKFWDKLKNLPLLSEVKINFPQGANESSMAFSITARVGG